jgi:hypothetical protein
MAGASDYDAIWKALAQITQALRPVGRAWLVGGSCGLLLHGVDLQGKPRDLDIYMDEIHTAEAYMLLQNFAVDKLAYNETHMYSSYLSHYQIHGVSVELVGGFQVKAHNSLYEVRIDTLLANHAITAELNLCSVKLMPLGHELVFNLLRERPDRYKAIAEQIIRYPETHMPPLFDIVRHCELSPAVIHELELLLHTSLS